MRSPVFLLILLGFLVTGCEKKISFNLDQQEPKLVVEGSVETDSFPRVVLTKSIGYFENIDASLLGGSFVHNADVFVSNGNITQKLKEYTVPVTSGLNLYYYGADSINNPANSFRGVLNGHYSLRIVSEGKEYTAATTIPAVTKVVDSIWWKPTIGGKTNEVTVMFKATDPPGYGDYVQYATKRNRQPYLYPATSAYDDLFVDGTTYELPLEPGINRSDIGDIAGGRYFRRGDTIMIKLSNIDKATFDFWSTLEYSYQSVGNPFSSPTKVLGNISDKALGYFGGRANQYFRLIVPH